MASEQNCNDTEVISLGPDETKIRFGELIASLNTAEEKPFLYNITNTKGEELFVTDRTRNDKTEVVNPNGERIVYKDPKGEKNSSGYKVDCDPSPVIDESVDIQPREQGPKVFGRALAELLESNPPMLNTLKAINAEVRIPFGEYNRKFPVAQVTTQSFTVPSTGLCPVESEQCVAQ